MAKIEDNSKRRSSEMDEQSVTSIPQRSVFYREPLLQTRKIKKTMKTQLILLKWKKFIEQAEENNLKNEESLRFWEDSFKKVFVKKETKPF
ncbi:unnamed protein product [Mucor hiemalis]